MYECTCRLKLTQFVNRTNYVAVVYKFVLIVSGPPNIRDNFLVKIEENSVNIPVELRQEPSAYPEQTTLHLFEWSKDGQSLSSPRVSEMTYSSVTFSSVLREDAGNYVVSATNYVSDSMSDAERIGTDTGNFQLDVICKLK